MDELDKQIWTYRIKEWLRYLIVLIVVILLILGIYLLFFKRSSTTSAVIQTDKGENLTIKQDNCKILDDGRKACKIGTATVNAGGVVTMNYSVEN